MRGFVFERERIVMLGKCGELVVFNDGFGDFVYWLFSLNIVVNLFVRAFFNLSSSFRIKICQSVVNSVVSRLLRLQ